MDVGIRADNLLVAYDLVRAIGAIFDADFEDVFIRSIYEQIRHQGQSYGASHPCA